MMHPSRRLALGLAGAGFLSGEARSQPAASWFDLRSDDGRQVPNLRLPVELVNEIDGLPGLLRAGARGASQTIYEFFDYNCPWCRAAAPDLDALLAATPDLRIGFVDNAVISEGSAAAGRIALAVAATLGSERGYAFHKDLLALKGPVDGARAMALAAEAGAERAVIEARANDPAARAAIQRSTRHAASLGLSATPSFVLGNTGLLGWPGPRSLARMVAAVESCDRPRC